MLNQRKKSYTTRCKNKYYENKKYKFLNNLFISVFSQNEFTLGLSGGLDSSVLLFLLAKMQVKFKFNLIDAEYYLNNSFSIKSGINYENKVVSKFNVMTGNLLDGNDNYIILPIL